MPHAERGRGRRARRYAYRRIHGHQCTEKSAGDFNRALASFINFFRFRIMRDALAVR